MSPKKPGYTLEEHEKLGLELQTMRDRLVFMTTELSKAYPFKVSDIAKKASQCIDSLRNVLDDKVCQENQTCEEAGRVYYRAGRADYVSPERGK